MTNEQLTAVIMRVTITKGDGGGCEIVVINNAIIHGFHELHLIQDVLDHL